MKSIRWFVMEALIAVGAAVIGWFLPDGLNQLAHLLHQAPLSVSSNDRFLSALVVFLFSTTVELIIAVREAARTIQDTLPTRVQHLLDSSLLKLFLENMSHNPQSATSIQRVATAAISPLTQGNIQVFEPRAVIIERALANAAQDIRLLSSSGLEVDIYDNNEITLRLANSSHFYRQIQRKAYQVPEEWTQTWMRFVDELGVKGITCEYVVLMERSSLIADRKKLDSMAKYLSAHRWEFLYCNLKDVLDSFGGSLPTDWNLEVFDQKLVKIQETPAGYYHGGIRLKVALHSLDERPELSRLNAVVSKHAKRYSPGLFRAELVWRGAVWPDQKNRSLVSLSRFTRSDFFDIFQLADEIQGLPTSRRTDLCKDRTLATVFFQPSTRTRLSFESAMLFVGGSYISFGHPEMTKASAGETLEDTVRVLEGYADILAIRHPRDDAAATAANLVVAPVINAGCGTLEHPTQALLDLYTIHVAFGAIDGLTIGLMGDLRLQRTVNSLIMALSNFNVTLHLISHPSRRLRPDTARYLNNGVEYHETDSFEDVLPTLNVLYTIRIDRDRTSGPDDYSSLRGGRRLTAHDLSMAKHNLLVLNPLPRDDELNSDVDTTSHAFYFQQAHLGRPLRAALIAMMLDRTPV